MIKRIIKKISLSGLLLVSFFNVQGQEVSDANVDRYDYLADSLLNNFRPDSAIYYLQHLSPFYKKRADSDGYTNTQTKTIKAYINTNQFDEAEEMANIFLNELLTEFPNAYVAISNTYQSLGRIQELFMGDLLAALNLYQQASRVLRDHSPSAKSTLSSIYKDISTIQFQIGQSDSSDYYGNKAMELLKNEVTPDFVEIGILYRQMAVKKYYLGQYDLSIELAKMGLNGLDKNNNEHNETLSGLFSALGIVYRVLDQIDSAYFYQQAALEINLKIFQPDNIRLAENYQNLANLMEEKGNYDLAEELLHKARKITLQNPNSDKLLSAYIYNDLGNISTGKYNAQEEAINFFEEAVAIIGDSEDQPSLYIKAIILYNLGNSYSERSLNYLRNYNDSIGIKDMSKGILHISQAIDIAENFEGFPPDGIASFHMGLATTLKEQGELELAKSHYYDAIDLLQGIQDQWPDYMGGIYSGLSELALEKGEMQAFKELAQQAEQQYALFKGERTNELIRLYLNAAKRHFLVGDFIAAEEHLEMAQKKNQLSPDRFVSTYDQAATYYLKAKISESRFDSGGDINKLKEAVEKYGIFSEFARSIFLKLQNYKDLISYIGIYHEWYFDYVGACYKLYQLTNDENYLKEALTASEISKSFLRKKTTLDKNLRAYWGVPDSVLRQESSIDANITYFMSKINDPQVDSLRLRTFEASLFSARQNKKQLQSDLAKMHPRYFNLKYSGAPASYEEIKKSFLGTENLIEYMIDKGKVYIFLVTGKKLSIKEITLPDNFEKTLSEFESGLKHKDMSLFKQAAQELHKYLFLPIEAELTSDRIIIIPDGRLWNINFDLLIDDQYEGEGNMPGYLLKRYAFSYKYTAATEKNTPSGKSKKIGFAAFSLGEYSDVSPDISVLRNTPSDLPGSALEIRRLSELYKGVFNFGVQSNEANFKKQASEYSVLHLALHGEINEQDYDNSKLYFKENLVDSLEDNFLYPFELYNMDLEADLVVLSACNSGAGSITRGEGIMSLGRAFQYAGANSLLLSKWEISDAVAPEIIIQFYENLDKGMPKDEALRTAKLTFLETADNLTKNPYFWGSFFVLGDPKPIKLQSGIDYTQIAIIFFLFIFSSMIAFRVRMKKRLNTKS